MKEASVSYEYQIGGSLPADASSYVTRQADLDFYESLKAGIGDKLRLKASCQGDFRQWLKEKWFST